jgi:putative ABC transport system permease protein
VISMLAIGEGSKRQAIEQIRQLGASNVIIRTLKPDEGVIPQPTNPAEGTTQEQQPRVLEYGLLYKDYERLKGTIPHLLKAVPTTLTRHPAQRQRLRMTSARILGTTPDFQSVRNLTLRRGRFLTWPDLRATDNVAVLGAGVARRLFAYEDPLGQTVLIGTQAFCVVGVLKAQASGNAKPGAVGQDDLNNDIYIPITTSQRRVGELQQTGTLEFERIQLGEITLTVADEKYVKSTAAMARKVLGQTHPKGADFEIQVPLELLEQAEHERRIWNLVLGSIASISLLVGGIGIMNIMLATVTERTREIGIRRALGAKRRDISLQFLIESTTLSALGGLLGVLLGIGIPIIVTLTSDIQTVLSWWSVLLAFAISVGIGMVFGVYPARRAALMDPIEALRHN